MQIRRRMLRYRRSLKERPINKNNMDYFRILNLKKEPFSNSPEPEFFFQSSKHLGCLQKLELAVRLRRGLNVVIGDVGTGKTTLCRQLILKFAGSEHDSGNTETHLLMDPAFTNPVEFLSAVCADSRHILYPVTVTVNGSSRKI